MLARAYDFHSFHICGVIGGNEHHDWPTSLHIKLALFSLSAERSRDGWLNVKSIRGH